ncbi:hypothetical protein MKEN_00290900 [Mycena kentingensis (nom. inval.)]|nr:hypothetical protein MKEN_00290900 [Mycena kentingensis (nom. inval.)]
MADSDAELGLPATSTLEVLLVGAAIALVLSGTLAVQCIVYYKLFPKERRIRHGMVIAVWLLDIVHSIFVVASLFNYLIDSFGDRTSIDRIPWSVALIVLVAALQALVAHGYYVHKIYSSSGPRWWFAVPIGGLAIARFLAVAVSAAEMLVKKRYAAFTERYPGWIFTLSLMLSVLVDVVIAGWLSYHLRRTRRRTRTSLFPSIVQTTSAYILENGLLTALVGTASMIFWLAMPQNRIFLALLLVASKLYPNSLLVSLNSRQDLHDMRRRPTRAMLSAETSPGGSPNYSSDVVNHGYKPYAFNLELINKSGDDAYHPAFKVATPLSTPIPASATPRGRTFAVDFGVGGVSPPDPMPTLGVRVTRTVRHDYAGPGGALSDEDILPRTSREGARYLDGDADPYGDDGDDDDGSPSGYGYDDHPYASPGVVAGRRNQFGAAAHGGSGGRGQQKRGSTIETIVSATTTTRSRSTESRGRAREERWRALP